MCNRLRYAEKDKPAVLIGIDDVQDYSKWIGNEVGKRIGVSIIGRLPTAAEWQKAAKGPGGDEFTNPATYEQAHFEAPESRSVNHPDVYVNGYGLKDMIGNVSEIVYCAEKINMLDGHAKACGGSFLDDDRAELRAAATTSPYLFFSDIYLGFRSVLVLRHS